MNILKRLERADSKTLKKKYLKYFSARRKSASTFHDIVRALIGRGVGRQILVRWAVEAGYSKSYVSSLLCQILCSVGMRVNAAGGGRKPSRHALELLDHARRRYGKNFLNVLRAAWRAGKAELNLADKGTRTKSIVEPQLPASRSLERFNARVSMEEKVPIRIFANGRAV